MAVAAPRSEAAPRGMIRAHMATFPPRKEIFRRVVDAMLPQVDRLVIVFNEFPEVPADIAANPKIEAVLPAEDLKDVGKFFSPPRPDDIVFLIDDDIGYPPDYVSRSIEQASAIGWDGAVFGYLGLNYRSGDDGRPRGWRQFKFHGKLGKPSGARLLGTGTVVARGDAIPALDWMLPYRGHADIGFALHSLRTGRKAWTLAKDEGWMTADLPDELFESSLFATARTKQSRIVVSAVREILAAPMDHAEIPHHKYVRAAAARHPAVTGV